MTLCPHLSFQHLGSAGMCWGWLYFQVVVLSVVLNPGPSPQTLRCSGLSFSLSRRRLSSSARAFGTPASHTWAYHHHLVATLLPCAASSAGALVVGIRGQVDGRLLLCCVGVYRGGGCGDGHKAGKRGPRVPTGAAMARAARVPPGATLARVTAAAVAATGSAVPAGAGWGGAAASARGMSGLLNPHTQHSLASGLFTVVQKHCQSAILSRPA